ncbi:FMN-binding protein [Christensenellaceae bacterium OttesenSCG-928-M15]|nr:FMN-binding protein [Christensenellaceae bacterium OttesenSCG-928-M15]
MTFYKGDDVVQQISITPGEAVSEPQAPQAKGHRSMGWYEKDAAEAFDFTTPIEQDTVLYAKFEEPLSGALVSVPTAFAFEQVNAEFQTHGEYGRVADAALLEDGVFIIAEGLYGLYENPCMTMGVTISKEGIIRQVTLLGYQGQTEGFPEQMTEEYLAQVYAGVTGAPDMEVDVVSGASTTSTAVLYAVQAAANYAGEVYGYAVEGDTADTEALTLLYPADYKQIPLDQTAVTSYGEILFAAEGIAQDGARLLGVKVKSNAAPVMDREALYSEEIPNPAMMYIVIDDVAKKVVAYEVVNYGTTKKKYFTPGQAQLDAYKEVEITGETVFDVFEGGLVKGLEIELETDQSGNSLITGTSIVYTGATINGTYTSQFIRDCYKAAARYYWAYQS